MLVDFHNHILPGVDDGARDAGETRAALLTMRDAGVHLVIATPHIRASIVENGEDAEQYRARISSALTDARAIAATETPGLTVELGAEIMLDDATVQLSDPLLRLAGTKFVLVEFSLFGVPPNAADMLFRLRAQGWQPVLGHPERYGGLSLSVVREWHATGLLLQVNAGSLMGDYGTTAKERAWELLKGGLVHYLCSDYHARGRFRVPAALAVLETSGGRRQREILVQNGVLLSRGEMPRPVPPLRRLPWYRTIFKRT
jgi:protein-tyrosine phosphatase